jgi:hypothetical protein
MRQQQSEIAEPAVIGDHTDIVWLTRQHGLLVRPARPSDSDGRFNLIFRDGALWAVIGTTRLMRRSSNWARSSPPRTAARNTFAATT